MMLYIHVPFCASHCSYCAFYSTTSTEALEQYSTTLLREIEYTSLLHGSIDTPIRSIFFGGGTPSFISAEYIAHVLTQIARTYPFSHDIEITIEANPESITQEKAEIWYNAGINRVSIGCQSFIPETLTLLQRIHSVERIYEAIDILRHVGFRNLSLDMIWGHCNQTTEQWLYELRSALSLGVEHLSCYLLTIEENTLLAKQYKLHTLLPSEEELCEMYLAGKELLTRHGYIQYEISNFAQEGYECKHNLGYWNDIPYYGYGPSASSYTITSRYTHPSSIQAWSTRISECCNKHVPLPNREERTKEIIYTELLFLGLRQSKGISLNTLNSYLPIPFEDYYKKQIEQLCMNSLITYNSSSIRVTSKGGLVLDSIIEQFLTMPQ